MPVTKQAYPYLKADPQRISGDSNFINQFEPLCVTIHSVNRHLLSAKPGPLEAGGHSGPPNGTRGSPPLSTILLAGTQAASISGTERKCACLLPLLIPGAGLRAGGHRLHSHHPPARQAGILTAVGGHLPLPVDQEQDEGKAEDAHDAGAGSQGSSCDACEGKESHSETPFSPFLLRGD